MHPFHTESAIIGRTVVLRDSENGPFQREGIERWCRGSIVAVKSRNVVVLEKAGLVSFEVVEVICAGETEGDEGVIVTSDDTESGIGDVDRSSPFQFLKKLIQLAVPRPVRSSEKISKKHRRRLAT